MGNVSGITGGCEVTFCWKDFPGTERICVGVVDVDLGVVEFRRRMEGSVDIDDGILERVGRIGFDLACLSERDD